MPDRRSASKHSIRISTTILAVAVWIVPLRAQSSQTTNKEDGRMQSHASGAFDVKLTPEAADEKSGGVIGRMSLQKRFHGDLEATSTGQMLSSGSAQGSGAYVAIELVTGTLRGRKGTFVLQHSGTMTKSVPKLTVVVVPDSGTGELAGLSGSMTIKIEGGKHFYELEYTLPEPAH